MSSPRPILTYLPWCPLGAEIEVGPLRLLPYRRGEMTEVFADAPGGHGVVDQVLGMYHGLDGAPIQRAAVVEYRGRLVSPLSPEERSETDEWVRVACFTALARRDILNSWEIANASHFALRFQEVMLGNDGQMTHLRRDVRAKFGSIRDGRRIADLDIGAPEQTGMSGTVDPDTRLAEAFAALHAARPHEWPLWMDAVTSFVEANSDSQGIGGVPTRIDHLLTTMALESLLSLGREEPIFRTNHLKAELDALLDRALGAENRVSVRDTSRSPRGAADDDMVAGAWAREFHYIRNDFGHGRRATEDATGWTLREHEVLGALVLPLLAKYLLSERGLYALGADDRAGVKALEAMMARHHPDPGRCFASWMLTLRSARKDETLAAIGAGFRSIDEARYTPEDDATD